jgi:hypothetical protein
MTKYLQNPKTKVTVTIIIALIIIIVAFECGAQYGFRKASFVNTWNSGIGRGMHDPRFMFAPFSKRNDDARPNGIVGEIVSLQLPSIMIKGKTTAEEVIIVNPQTIIHKMRDVATTTDLKIGDTIVVIGKPNTDGQIQASFVRILPQGTNMGIASSTMKGMMGNRYNNSR